MVKLIYNSKLKHMRLCGLCAMGVEVVTFKRNNIETISSLIRSKLRLTIFWPMFLITIFPNFDQSDITVTMAYPIRKTYTRDLKH